MTIPNRWIIYETPLGPNLRLWQYEDDEAGLTFEECRTLIITGYKLYIQDWENYTEEDFLE